MLAKLCFFQLRRPLNETMQIITFIQTHPRMQAPVYKAHHVHSQPKPITSFHIQRFTQETSMQCRNFSSFVDFSHHYARERYWYCTNLKTLEKWLPRNWREVCVKKLSAIIGNTKSQREITVRLILAYRASDHRKIHLQLSWCIWNITIDGCITLCKHSHIPCNLKGEIEQRRQF